MHLIYKSMIIVVVFCSVLAAHTGKVRGVVSDSLSGKPIALTNVLILKTGIGTAANDKGEYLLEAVPEGTYQIQFSHMGYATVVKNITVVSEEELLLNIYLKQVILNLAEIDVTSELNPNEKIIYILTIDHRKDAYR